MAYLKTLRCLTNWPFSGSGVCRTSQFPGGKLKASNGQEAGVKLSAYPHIQGKGWKATLELSWQHSHCQGPHRGAHRTSHTATAIVLSPPPTDVMK